MRSGTGIFSLLIFPLFLFSQVEIPQSAKAKYALLEITPFFDAYDTIYVDDFPLDTFNGTPWKSVYIDKYDFRDGSHIQDYPRRLCYIREDGESIYYRNLEVDPEFLEYLREGEMYDFSLQSGDSLWLMASEFHPVDTVRYVVDSIDIQDCGELGEFKIMHVRYLADEPEQNLTAYYAQWIKPIGDLYHPFPSAVCIDEWLCEEAFIDMDVFLNGRWVDSRQLTCEDLLSSVDYQNVVPSRLRMYPNPWRSGEAFHLKLPGERIETVGVFAVGSGRQLFERTFVPSEKIITRLPWLRPGAYLVVAQTVNGAVMVEKMVVR